jgi:hypothetical protein
MNVIDEEVLRHELRGAADDLEVSTAGIERIKASARSPINDDQPPRLLSAVQGHPRRQRFFAAAAMVVAVTAISIPLMRTETTPSRTVHASGLPARADKTLSGSVFSPTNAGLTFGVAQSTGQVTLTAAAPAKTAVKSSTKIESSGQVDLTVHKGGIGRAFTRLTALATSDDGTVVNSQIQRANAGNGNFAYGTITLQVPQPRFAQLVGQAQHVGRTTSVTTSSVDVTGQYVDLRARITALQAARRQYLAIMAKAASINDILAVQAQLNSLQSRIEQLQGQLNLLDHQTTYASLTVTLIESGHHVAPPKHENGISRAFHGAVHGFVAGFEWLIRASGPALFAALCLGVLLFLARFGWRAMRRRTL